MDLATAQYITIVGIIIFVMATGLFFDYHKKNLECICRHYQDEHRPNFGFGGRCYVRGCDCQIFEEGY